MRTDSVDARRRRGLRACCARRRRPSPSGGRAPRQRPRPPRRPRRRCRAAAPRAAAPRGRRHVARRARRRARRQPAGDEEPRPPRAHQPRQAARRALERLPGGPRGPARGARRGPPRVGRDLPPRGRLPRLPPLPRRPEGHAQGRGDPAADAADGRRLRPADRQGRRRDAKGAIVKSTATAAAGVAITAGAVGVGVQVFGRGEPAPQPADSRALPSARWPRAATCRPAPRWSARRSRSRPVAPAHPPSTLPCPAGTRVADLIGARGASASYARGTVVGVSRSATVLVQPRPGSKATSAVVTVFCKRPTHRARSSPGSRRAGRRAGSRCT